MATSLRKAQDVLLCHLCEASPVQMHCNLCATNLCEGCVGKHISKDPTKDHNVVIFKMRNVKPILPTCKNHKGQNCEMHCRQCAKPVCVKCIASGSHKTHDMTDLMELCNAQKNIIEKKTKELEKSIYPQYEREISETETQIAKLAENHEKLMASITDQGDEWHRQIDIIIKTLKTEAGKMKTDNLEILQKHLSKLKKLLSEIHQAILDNKNLLQSNNVTNIMDHKDKTLEFDEPPTRVNTYLAFSPLPIQVEQLYQMFGSLTSSPLSDSRGKISSSLSEKQHTFLDSSKVKRDIDSSYNGVVSVACLGNEDLWVCGYGSNKLKYFNNQGILSKTIKTKTGNYPTSVTVTPDGNLVLSVIGDRSIYTFRDGKHEKMITLQGWVPNKICSTASGDLLVSMFHDDDTKPKKVVRYSGSTEKQVIQFDQYGKPLFSTGAYVLFIDENRNGDLCVSDFNAKQVVVINQSGSLRFRYTGNLSSNKYKSFNPRGIVTDSEGHILIADCDNNAIHIISEDGHFIRYIDNCQLSEPGDLSLGKNMLYVGEVNTSKVKVIQYLA